MAGVAANVSAFNTVVTYDLWEPYVKPGESDDYYIRFGRIATTGGILIGIGTALIASGYNNIMDYIQLLFSFFNAPLFATFIVGMFWRRMTPWAGFWGLVAGTLGAAAAHFAHAWEIINLGSDQAAAFWGAIVALSPTRWSLSSSPWSRHRSPSMSCRASSTAWPTSRKRRRPQSARGTGDRSRSGSARSG
jgi:SSS family solute:Na+ symporter